MNYVVWFSVGIKVTAFCQSTQEGSTAGDPNRAAVSTFITSYFKKHCLLTSPTSCPQGRVSELHSCKSEGKRLKGKFLYGTGPDSLPITDRVYIIANLIRTVIGDIDSVNSENMISR
jgi:hypothetical protein